MRVRFLSVALSVVLCTVVGRADEQDVKKVAKAKAEEMVNLLVKGDYDGFAGHFHPDLIEKGGGKEKLVEKMKSELKAITDKGYRFKAPKFLEPGKLVVAKEETFLTLPYRLEITVPSGGRLVTESVMIGVSADMGKTWKFLDGNPGREETKKLFPRLPDDLVIPKRKPPVFEKD